MPDYTRMLNDSSGFEDDSLYAGLYAELRRIARGRMALEKCGHTLNPTALVHEAWLRIQKSAPEKWRDRKQFYAAASETMRRILIEAARQRLSAKRGGGEQAIPIDGLEIHAAIPDRQLIDIHEILDELEREDETKAQIVKLRFFSGMNHDEIAALLEVNEKTVRRHWALAKIWLYRAIKEKE
jgi:RNA polymerase sigma factor (TIGR02999 family)